MLLHEKSSSIVQSLLWTCSRLHINYLLFSTPSRWNFAAAAPQWVEIFSEVIILFWGNYLFKINFFSWKIDGSMCEWNKTILQHFTQWNPVTHCCSLRDVSCRQSCHLSTPSHPRVPPVWPYCRQAQCGRWRSLKWSIADLLTSSHPQMSASHLLRLQVRSNGPSFQETLQTLIWLEM